MTGRLLASLVVVALAACTPAPAPAPPAPRAAETGCARCHAEIAREWAASYHRVSFTDATYQKSLAMEAPGDRPWCNGCHAPAASPAAGVDCASCHGERYDRPHAAPHGATAATPTASVRCVPCHEFPFPGRAELVQKTASEHAASEAADVACASCHLPRANGHRDHRFALAGHAPDAIARTVRLEAAPVGRDAIRVVVRSDAGHAFPTGDMFRRVRLEIVAEGARGELVSTVERSFTRTWSGRAHPGTPPIRTEIADTRIRGTWSETVPLDPSAPVARARVRLVYERVLAAHGEAASVASSDVLHELEVRF